MAYTCAYYPTADATLDEAQRRRWTTCAESCGSARGLGDRGGLRLGRPGAAHREPLRRKVRAFNISRSRSNSRAGGRRIGDSRIASSSSRTTTATSRALATCSFRSACWSTSDGRIIPSSGRDLARPGTGRAGLIHSIGRNGPNRFIRGSSGASSPAHIPSLGEMMQIFEPFNLSVLDVENLRLHYAARCGTGAIATSCAAEGAGPVLG